MDIKARLQAIFQKEKLTDKAKSGELTLDEWTKVAESYKAEHGTDMYADINAEKVNVEKAQQNAEKAAAHDSALQLLNAATTSPESNQNTDDDDEAEKGAGGKKSKVETPDMTEKLNALIAQNKEMKTALEEISTDNAEVVDVNLNINGTGMAHSATHLFGVQSEIFSLENRWNKLMQNKKAVAILGSAGKDDSEAFDKQFRSFAGKIATAFENLHDEGLLSAEFLRSNSNPDLTALTNAGLGEQFVQFRTRELIARVLELPDIFGIFPKRSGIQDRDLMTNAFVGELTQASQDSEDATKGSVSIDPEMGYVDDAMILSKFGSYKELERKYIAYLNSDGSSAVKWSMIEWSLLLYMKQARKEQMQRYVRGIYLKPVADVAGHFLNASTGILNRIKLYHIERKLKAIDEAGLIGYDGTGTNFIDTVIEFGNWLIENLGPLGIEQSEIKVYLNANHKHWFKAGYRSRYNTHGDFDGIETAKVPDTEIAIEWYPNGAQSQAYWATPAGNLQCLENIPGEMFKFYLEQRLKSVYVNSEWKEGTAAGYAGRLAADEAALAARGWDEQMIWFPKQYIELAEDVNAPDVADGDWWKTLDNTGATNISTIANKKVGELYIIECGGTDNATTVNKTGDFDSIKANFVPTAVGDALGVVWDAGAGKFKEIFRKVGGALSYNTTTSPFAGAR